MIEKRIFDRLFYEFLRDYAILIRDYDYDIYLSDDYPNLKEFIKKINLLGYSIFYNENRKIVRYKDLFVEAFFILEDDKEVYEDAQEIRSTLLEDPYELIGILHKDNVLSAIKHRFEELLLDDYDNIVRDLEALKRDVSHSSS